MFVYNNTHYLKTTRAPEYILNDLRYQSCTNTLGPFHSEIPLTSNIVLWLMESNSYKFHSFIMKQAPGLAYAVVISANISLEI